MNSKIIIVTTLILILASFSLLYVVEKMNDNYDYQKSWTVVYFAHPSDSSLDFSVENHQGIDEKYSYEIFAGDQSVATGNVEIPAAGTQKISPELDLGKIAQLGAARIAVQVSLGDVKYMIYKNIQ
jgi:hypothetical protein